MNNIIYLKKLSDAASIFRYSFQLLKGLWVCSNIKFHSLWTYIGLHATILSIFTPRTLSLNEFSKYEILMIFQDFCGLYQSFLSSLSIVEYT